MKLRVRGNSVRIRVSQGELEQLSREGIAEDRVRFADDAQLTYRIVVGRTEDLRASFRGSEVSVSVPKASFDRWLAPEEVSVSGEQPIGRGETLKILVEKDFACLAPRSDEDQSDLFPNPSGAAC